MNQTTQGRPQYEATVCYPSKRVNNTEHLLLGQRSSTVMNGKWNGPGGKFNRRELRMKERGILPCLHREVREETSVAIDITTAVHIATVDYHHPWQGSHTFEWRVHFLTVTVWQGDFIPVQGFSEFRWFPRSALPWSSMMTDAKFWMPLTEPDIAQGKILQAEIFYGDPDLKTVDKGTFRYIPGKVQQTT